MIKANTKKQENIVIIGAGFAGLSAAYHLARYGCRSILVLEREEKPALHASGKNAGMIRQSIEDTALSSVAVYGRKLMSQAHRKDKKGFGFKSNGTFLLSDFSDKVQLEKIQHNLAACGVPSKIYLKKEAAKKVAILSGVIFDKALHCPSDALVDIDALTSYFYRQLKQMKVRVLFKSPVDSIEKTPDGNFCVASHGRSFIASSLINASGAWALDIAAKAGASQPVLKAYQRHLFESEDYPGDVSRWPFIWDVNKQYYFRPLKKSVLMSPCDKKLFKFKSPEYLDSASRINPEIQKDMTRKLNKFMPELSRLRIKYAKAALRTMTEDGRFLIGQDGRNKNFYWLAALGGHGVTTSFAVGDMLARIILGKKVNRKWVKAFDPKRFKS